MRQALPELAEIVPGHGPMGDGTAALDTLIEYLTRLGDEVAAAFSAGRSLAETEELCTNPWTEGLDPTLAKAMTRYPIPAARAQQGMLQLCRNLHRLNVLATYRIHSK